MVDLIRELTPEQALEVVRRLSGKDAQIREAVLREAMSVLEIIDLTEIAEDVFGVLDILDVHDLWDKSGAQRDGYFPPEEVAAEMIEEELDPYIEQVRKYLRLGMLIQARTYCMGVLYGIYQFDRESKSEFRQWAEDIPLECFRSLLGDWKKDNENCIGAEMNEFLRGSCSDWVRYILEKEG